MFLYRIDYAKCGKLLHSQQWDLLVYILFIYTCGRVTHAQASFRRFLASIHEQMLMLRYAMANGQLLHSCNRIKAFIRFSRMKHPVELGEAEVQQFLSHSGHRAPCGCQDSGPGVGMRWSSCIALSVTAPQLEMKFTRSQRPSQTAANRFDAK